MDVDLGAAGVGDGDAGVELPSGVLQGNLDYDAVGGGGFDFAAAAGELVATGGAGVPADDAVDGRGAGGWGVAICGGLRRRSCVGEIHARDVAFLAAGRANAGGVAFVVGENG